MLSICFIIRSTYKEKVLRVTSAVDYFHLFVDFNLDPENAGAPVCAPWGFPDAGTPGRIHQAPSESRSQQTLLPQPPSGQVAQPLWGLS